jgi:hypothetical protein
MGLKIFGVGSVDQKSNNLLRDDKDLVDSRNIMANINGEYVKRPGTENDPSFIENNYDDIIFIKSLNQYFHKYDNDYVVYENGVRKTIYKYADPADTGLQTRISLAEYLNTAIFTHIDGANFTAKYDGNAVYRAGLPTPTITGYASGSKFGLFFYQFIDAKGNTIYGPATIVRDMAANGTLTVSTFSGGTGFYGGFLVKNLTAFTPFFINSSNRTLNYVKIGDDYQPGSIVTFRTQLASPTLQVTINGSKKTFFVQFVIESINVGAKTITFTADSVGDNEVQFDCISTGDYDLTGHLSLACFTSDSETTGYTGNLSYSFQSIYSDVSTNVVSYYPVDPDKFILLSDIYDLSTSKLRPPRCKYVYTYGYQLVCAPALSFYDFENNETLYTNNDLVMYSDVSAGDLGESFSESNRQLIGNTYDGEISALARVKDSLIAFKDRSIWSLDGILIPGQYALRKIESNEIGCLSSKSILSIDSGLLFQGQDGIYGIDGYKCEKISTRLDPFFVNVDKTLTRSVMNNSSDQHIFWTNQGMVVFDYEYKNIYIWSGINAESGITVDNQGSLRFFSLTTAKNFRADGALNDSGVAIDAFIRSAWFNLSEPGLLKKATDIRLYAFNNAGQTVLLKYFLDWSESKVKGPFTVNMSDASIKTIHRNLDIILNQSFSFELRNNIIDEDLNISGYEIQTTVIQDNDKNVK